MIAVLETPVADADREQVRREQRDETVRRMAIGLARLLGHERLEQILRRGAEHLRGVQWVQEVAQQLAEDAFSGAGAKSVSELASAAGCDYQGAYRMLRRWGVRRPEKTHRHISEETHQEIVRCLRNTELTRRQIADRHGVSKGSVDRRAAMLRRRVISKASTEVAYRRERWHCPRHGWVSLRPCVACLAQEAASAKN